MGLFLCELCCSTRKAWGMRVRRLEISLPHKYLPPVNKGCLKKWYGYGCHLLLQSYQYSPVYLKLKKLGEINFGSQGEKGMAILHRETVALRVQHPSIPCSDTYTIPCSLPLPPHCWMCLDAGLLSELLSLWHAFATDIYMKAIGLAGNNLHW